MRLLGLLDRAARLAHVAQPSTLQIGRDIHVGLKDAQLSHRRLAHAARRQVGDATVGEFDARVGDIDVTGEHAKAARRDVGRLGARQRAGEIEVMDHEVEHHVDLGAAPLESGEALGLDEHRAVHARLHRAEGPVIALDMPTLQHEPPLAGERDQLVGLGERGRNRLLDQQVQAVLQAIARDGVVPVGGDGDHRRLCFAEYRAVIAERRSAKRLCAPEVGIDHRGHLDARQTREFLRVVAAHVAGADDGDVQ